MKGAQDPGVRRRGRTTVISITATAPCRHRVPDRCGGHHRVWQPVITCGWVDRRRSVVNPIRSGCPRPRIARRCSPPQAIGWVAVWTACEHGRTDIYAATSEDGAVQLGAPVRVNDVEGEAHVYGEDPPRVAIVPSAAQSQAVLPETVEAINSWQQYAANEYGFYANLNPAVDHRPGARRSSDALASSSGARR